MALRNAFENVATEAKQDELRQLLSDRLVAGLLTGPVVDALTTVGSKQDAARAVLDAVEAALGGTLDVADATGEAKLEAIRLLLAGTIAVADTTAETKLEAVRALLAGTLTVTVSNPTANPETGLAKDATLGAAKQDLDSLVATAGSTADASSAQTLVGLLKQVVANTSNIKTDLDSIQISDSHIDLEVGGVETRLDTANAALGAPGDTAAANTIIGRLKALIAALGSPAQDATVSSLVTAAGGPGSGVAAISGNGSGIQGLLRMIWDTLRGNLTVTAAALTDGTQRIGGTVQVDSSTADGVLAGDGRRPVTAAGTALALAGSTPCKWVIVTAFSSNTDRVAVGTASVLAAVGAQRGVTLAAGQSAVIPASNLNAVFVDSRVSGEGVAYAWGA